MVLQPPAGRDDWLGLSADALPVADVTPWVSRPGCGGVVMFLGTVRDHADGRPDVTGLHYEAYDEEVVPRFEAVAAEARRRWPDLARLVVLHRRGDLAVSDVSVVVAASAPHRAEAFEAARFAIDAVKASVPIWKRETWSGGEDWSTCAHAPVEASLVEASPVEASPVEASLVGDR